MTGKSRHPAKEAAVANRGDIVRSRQASAVACRLLETLEDQLVDQSIAFAKTNGYAPYTTTIRAAWVEAVRSLTETLGSFLAEAVDQPRGPRAEVKYREDMRFARMRFIARRHRALGITLEMYLGLFKHFRRAYVDALGPDSIDPALRAYIVERTIDFFDETELSVTADWTATGGDARLSELQAQTRSLTLAKDRYIAIFESLRNPACLLDRARGLVHANQAALDLFVAESEAGDSLYRHDRRKLVARVEEMLEHIVNRDEASGPSIWIDTFDGRRCFDVRLLRLHDTVGNTALGFLVQLYDVTSYREATDTARNAEQHMSRFLATMSHEIRTPLHAVLGAADLMGLADQTERDIYLDVIKSAGQALLHTLNNVLDYSKLENGPPMPKPIDTEIGPAVQTFCGMAVVGPGDGWERLSFALAPDVPARVRIDWAMTQQVLTNLVANALRHDRGGGVVIRVGRRDRSLRFEVVDHGPGLPSEEAEALFRPFQEISARPTDAGGTGLGLAISRLLVGSMGGRIDYEADTRGTRIWFDVPFADAGQLRTVDHTLRPTASPQRRHCLLVDDDEIGAMVTSRQLESVGFTVDHAVSVKDARAAFKAQRYDAVVLDYLLPDGTGPSLLADLKRTGTTDQTRFVALTANAEALEVSPDLRAGFARILSKPTDTNSLAEALNQPRAEQAPTARSCGNRTPCDVLDGLSDETVAAMAAAFSRQWEDLRRRIKSVRSRDAGRLGSSGLEDVAHRLAGSSAQLGLTDIAALLRDLEDGISAEETEDLAKLLERIDRPLEDTAQWRDLPLDVPAS